MLVGRGSLTFRTYRVAGKGSQPSQENVIDKLSAFRFTGLGSTDEGTASGWIAPEHLFDGEFAQEKVFHDHFACFALRMDTRKVPSALLIAHVYLEEKAWREANGQDRIPASRRREIKREVKAKLIAELPPTQRAYGVFWNVRARKLYFQSTSKKTNEELLELFSRTFELDLVPQFPSVIAEEHVDEPSGGQRLAALQDAQALKLGSTPEQARAAHRRAVATATAAE